MASCSHLVIFICAGLLCSCSASRHSVGNECVLKSNTVIIPDSLGITKSDISTYIKQQPKFGRKAPVFNESLMLSSARSIEKRLKYLGYYGSRTECVADIRNGKAKVTYNILPGKRYLIDRVEFDIPQGGDFEKDFLRDTSFLSVRAGTYLSEKSLESESSRSCAALRSKGYFALSNSSYSFQADSSAHNGRVSLKYSVKPETFPFKKVYFADVSFNSPGDVSIKQNVISQLNLISSGSPYSEKTVNDTYNRLSSLRIFSSVGIALTQTSADSVNCEISLNPSLPQGFKTNLEVSTNSSALMGISPQVEYYHKNIFGGGEWLTLGFTGNFQFKLDNSLHATESGISASLSLPRFLGIPYSRFPGAYIPRTEFNLSFSHQDRPEYERNIFSLSMGYNGRLGDALYYKFYPLSVNYVYMGSIDSDFAESLNRNPYMRYTYQDHLDAGVSFTLYHTTSLDVVPRGDYSSNRFTADFSGNVLSLLGSLMPENAGGQALIAGAPFSQYIRGEYSYSHGYSIGSNAKTTLAFRLLCGAGYAYGNSSSMPYEKQFYCGGAQSMRGWQVRSLGPGASELDRTFAIPSQTGDFKMEVDMELRFLISGIMEGALFLETGNVWKMKDMKSSFYKESGVDYGTGIRFNLDFLLVRVDMGIVLHDPSTNLSHGWINPATAFRTGNYALHFGVGYPF